MNVSANPTKTPLCVGFQHNSSFVPFLCSFQQKNVLITGRFYPQVVVTVLLLQKCSQKNSNVDNNALTIRFWLFGCSCMSGVTAIKKKPVALLMSYIPHTGHSSLEPMESRIQKTGSRRILCRSKTMENLHMPSNSEKKSHENASPVAKLQQS